MQRSRKSGGRDGAANYVHNICLATEQYQDLGTREDAYAGPPTATTIFQGGVKCLIDEAKIALLRSTQLDLLEET